MALRKQQSILMLQQFDHAAMLATQFNGGYYVAMPWRASVDDLIYMANDSDIVAMVVHPDLVPQARKVFDACPSVRHLFTLGPCDIGEDVLAGADDSAGSGDLDKRTFDPDQICLLWYTGGTTGVPKGSIHTQRSVFVAMERNLIRELLDVPNEELIVCGMALGYIDEEEPANRLRVEREPIEVFTTFHSD